MNIGVNNENNVRSIWQGFGMHPKYVNQVLGTVNKRNISKETPLSWIFLNQLIDKWKNEFY